MNYDYSVSNTNVAGETELIFFSPDTVSPVLHILMTKQELIALSIMLLQRASKLS